MFVSISQVLLLALLASCLGSFAWGMQRFFTRPSGYTRGMGFTSLCGIACAVAHVAAILLGVVSTVQAWLAAIVYLVSLGLYWWAISTNNRKRLSAIYSTDAPTHLVQQGPYRFIRHPLYSSYLLTWVAGVIASGQLWLLASVALMLTLYIQAAGWEERKFLGTPLAGAYREYRAHAGLFVPNPFKLRSARGSRRGVWDATGVE